MQNHVSQKKLLRFFTVGLAVLVIFDTASPINTHNENAPYWQQIYTEIEQYCREVGQNLEGFVKEKKLFLEKFWQNRKTIGAIAPSSKFLAKAMTEHLVHYNRPLQILEVGAGTGVFTEYIIKNMPKGSTLHVVEIEKEFCKILTEKFKDNPNVRIYCCSILDLRLSSKVDCIISGLPFNSLSPDIVEQILNKYINEFIMPEGIITFFEYILLPTLKKLFLQNQEYKKVLDLLTRFKKKRDHVQSTIVMRNLPPARVITCFCQSLVDC